MISESNEMQIKNIVIDSDTVTFISSEFEVMGFENIFQSYEIGDTIGTIPIKINA